MKEYTKICPVCGKEFQPRGIQIYCSAECRLEANGKSKSQPKTCEVCGKEFQPYGTQKYCSKECAKWALGKRERARRGNAIRPKTCPTCGTIFRPTQQNRYYCSKECAQEGASRRSLAKTYSPRAGVTVYRPENELHRLAVEARQHGLSYGQYVAMKEKGARYE